MEHHVRQGFAAVTPYLTVQNAAALIDFIVAVFDAEVIERSEGPGGSISHAVVRIDDSMIELSEATDEWGPRAASLHVYVEDTEETFERALGAGATSIYEPTQMPYGERSGGVEDAFGNYWYIATADD